MLSLCPTTTLLLLDFYWKDERKGNFDYFIVIRLTLNGWWFCHICVDKALQESNWLKPMSFFQKAHSARNIMWIKNHRSFSFVRVFCIIQRKLCLTLFSNLFSFPFPCTVDSCLFPTVSLVHSGSCMCGLCTNKLCLLVY